MSVQGKKRDWFDLGAKAYSQACPGIYAVPTYVCPICRKPFTVEALDDGRLSMEHVPPQSVGGCELLLTCTACNNTAGTKLDAAAKTKEDVRLALRSEEHTSELQSPCNLVCRLLLEKKKQITLQPTRLSQPQHRLNSLLHTAMTH